MRAHGPAAASHAIFNAGSDARIIAAAPSLTPEALARRHRAGNRERALSTWRGPQPWCGARVFVFLHRHRLPWRPWLARATISSAKKAALDGAPGTRLASRRERVLILPRHLIVFGDIFRRFRHRVDAILAPA